jgi:hypothetical protein
MSLEIVSNVFSRVLNDYIEVINALLRALFKPYGIDLRIGSSGSIDERLAKIDQAKSNLSEALVAIDDLKLAAQQNKRETEDALLRMEKLKEDKIDLEMHVQTLRQLADTDTEAFRRIAGILSPQQIRRERILGFTSGVLASILASGVVWLIVQGIKWIFPTLAK